MMRSCVIALLLSAGMAVSCGRVPSGPGVVALVDGAEITLEDFRREYVGHLVNAGLPDDLRRRYAFLNRLVGMKLLVQESRHNGLSDTEEYRLQENVISAKLLVDMLIQRTLLDSMQTTDSDLEEMLVRVNTQLKARHLYARTRPEADRLHARLLAGESFEDLAREVFNDPRLSESGGSLGFISFDELDPAFEDAAFGLSVGQISDPVRTAQGFSIIQVEDRFTKPILTETDFANKRDQLEVYVRTRKETSARRAFLQEIIERASPVTDDEVLAVVFATISGSRLVDSGDDEGELLNRTFVAFEDDGVRRTWTVRDFQAQAALSSSEQRAAVHSPEDLRAFVHGLVARTIMTRRASSMDLNNDPAFKKASASALESWLYERAYNAAVAEINVEPDSIDHYYKLFDDEFTSPERIQVGEILVASRGEADRAQTALASSPFSSVAREYSIRPGSEETGGDLGMVSREQLGILADRVFEADRGDTIGPVEVDGMFVLLQVGKREPARQAPLEDVRSEIENMIRQMRKQAALRQRIETLKGIYAISLKPEGLDTLNLTAHVSS